MLSRVDGGMGSGRETCGDVAAGSGYLVSMYCTRISGHKVGVKRLA